MEETFDAVLLQQRRLLAVLEVGVGRVLDDALLAVDLDREEAAQRVGAVAVGWSLRMTGGAAGSGSAFSRSCLISRAL